jgi:hypothetical protein
MLVVHGHALGAFGGIDLIDLVAGGDGIVGAFWLAGTAADALFID